MKAKIEETGSPQKRDEATQVKHKKFYNNQRTTSITGTSNFNLFTIRPGADNSKPAIG
jgi:hypothetical protein